MYSGLGFFLKEMTVAPQESDINGFISRCLSLQRLY